MFNLFGVQNEVHSRLRFVRRGIANNNLISYFFLKFSLH